LPSGFIIEDPEDYARRDGLHGVVGYEVFKHVQRQ
jgi:hypothetical protein